MIQFIQCLEDLLYACLQVAYNLGGGEKNTDYTISVIAAHRGASGAQKEQASQPGRGCSEEAHGVSQDLSESMLLQALWTLGNVEPGIPKTGE